MIADAADAARLIPQAVTVAVTSGGVWGVLKLVHAFQRDFFTDYRTELGEMRTRLSAVETKSNQNEQRAHRCEERESVLRRALNEHGIDIPDDADV